MSLRKDLLITFLSKELQEENLAIFAGAGFSRSAGFVDWKNFLKPIAEELELDVDKENDLVTLAQYYCNHYSNNRSKISDILVTEFCSKNKSTINHDILARLPISTYWTTNYDHLIEDALKKHGKVVDVKYEVAQLTITVPHRDAIVYKMHGDVDHPYKTVLIRDDYERYHIDMQPFITALSGDLVSKTLLFLGFSFSDPNLDYILSRVRLYLGNNQRAHYTLLKKVKKEECEDDADYEYKKKKQKLFVLELKRFGIITTYIEDYEEIKEILEELEESYKKKTIFISGAAHEYGKFNREDVDKFVFELSKDISRNNFRIVSGFGLGIGSAVISGVLDQTIMNGKKLNNDNLIIRPFPQGDMGKTDLWTQYRNDMLSYSGIAIFLFGNKLKDNRVVNSDGMLEEFEIASRKNIFIIPVGMTGFVSKKIWEIVSNKFDEKKYKNGAKIKQLLEGLGDENIGLNIAKNNILNIINLLKG